MVSFTWEEVQTSLIPLLLHKVSMSIIQFPYCYICINNYLCLTKRCNFSASSYITNLIQNMHFRNKILVQFDVYNTFKVDPVLVKL